MRRASFVVLALVAGCARAHGSARPGTTAEDVPREPPPPEAAAADADAGATEPDAAPAGTAPATADAATPPKFLALDADLRAAYPLHAKIKRAGVMYAQPDGPPLNTANGSFVVMPMRVVEATLPRPRILCEGIGTRVAVYVDRADLATVASEGALMVPWAPVPTAAPTTPGVHLGAGAEIAPLGGATDVQKATYRGLYLRAEGVVDATRIGFAYTDARLPPDGTLDAELTQSTMVVDAPKGAKIADIDRSPKTNVFVHRLGPSRDGFTLVRFDEGDAYVIGWIASTTLKPAPALHDVVHGSASGIPRTPRPGKHALKLRRGTLLLAGTTPIGIVTKDITAPCVSACTSPEPEVEIPACADVLHLHAHHP